MSDKNEFLSSDALNKETIEVLMNTEAHKVSDEEKSKLGNGADKENEALRQNTANLQANTHAQKLLTEEKEKFLKLSNQFGSFNTKKTTLKASYQNALNNSLYEEAVKGYAEKNKQIVVYGLDHADINGLVKMSPDKSEMKKLALRDSKGDSFSLKRVLIPEDNGRKYFDTERKYRNESIAQSLPNNYLSNKFVASVKERLVTGKQVLDFLIDNDIDLSGFLNRIKKIGVKSGNDYSISPRYIDGKYNVIENVSSEKYELNKKNSITEALINQLTPVSTRRYSNMIAASKENLTERELYKYIDNEGRTRYRPSLGERIGAGLGVEGDNYFINKGGYRDYPYENSKELRQLLNVTTREIQVLTNGLRTEVISKGDSDSVEMTDDEYKRFIKIALEMKREHPEREVFDFHNHPYNKYRIGNLSYGRAPSGEGGDEESWSLTGGFISAGIFINDINELRVYTEELSSSIKGIALLFDNFGSALSLRLADLKSTSAYEQYFDIKKLTDGQIGYISDQMAYNRGYDSSWRNKLSSFMITSQFPREDPISYLSNISQENLMGLIPDVSKYGREYIGHKLDKDNAVSFDLYLNRYLNNLDFEPQQRFINGFYELLKARDGLLNFSGSYGAIGISRDLPTSTLSNIAKTIYGPSDPYSSTDYLPGFMIDYGEKITNLKSNDLDSLYLGMERIFDSLNKILGYKNSYGEQKAQEALINGDLQKGYYETSFIKDGSSLLISNNRRPTRNSGISMFSEGPVSYSEFDDINSLILLLKQSLKSLVTVIDDAYKHSSQGGSSVFDKLSYDSFDKFRNITSVHDMVLTDDGRLIKTDPKDTLVALANPTTSFNAMQNVRNERGEVIGILSNADAARIDKLTDTMSHFSKMTTRPEQFDEYNNAKRAIDEILQVAKENKHFYDLALESDKKIFNHSSAYLQTYGFSEYLPVFEDMRNRNYINDFGNEIAASIDNGKNARAAYLAVSNVRHAALVGEPYDKYGFVGNDIAYQSDNYYKNSKIKEFRENVRNSIQEYTESALDKAARDFRGTLFNPEDDKQFIKNRSPLLLDSPQWWKEAQEISKGIIRDANIRDYENRYSNAIVPVGQPFYDWEKNRSATYVPPYANFSGYDSDTDALINGRRRFLAEEEARRKAEEEARIKHNNEELVKNSLLATRMDSYKEYQEKSSDNEQKLRSLREALYKFERLSSFATQLESDPLITMQEKKIIENFKKRKDMIGNFSSEDWSADGQFKLFTPATGKSAIFEEARTNLLNFINTMDNPALSRDEKLARTNGIEDIFNKYSMTLTNFLNTLNTVNAETENEIKIENERNRLAQESIGLIEKENKEKGESQTINQRISRRSMWSDYKYSPIRSNDEQKKFKDELPWEFSTTGNLKDSYRRTLFNRSVGYRQRQGAVGFMANMGYNMSGTLLSVGLGAFAKAISDATKATLNFTKESVQAYGELQLVKTNLGIVYGSRTEADNAFNEIAQYAVKSPFGVKQTSDYAVLLKQSGIYASDLMDTLKQIGDVAGGNQQKFANIANAFAMIEAYGRATTRQLRQFATAGLPIYQELVKAYKDIEGKDVDVGYIRKLTEQGKITSDIIEKAFKNMTGDGGIFENAVEIGAKTWQARQQNLADAKQLAQSSIGEYVINIGGTGRNDSIAQRLLGMKEGLFTALNNLFTLKNISKNVDNIAKKESDVKYLKGIYETAKENGASEDVLISLEKEIKRLEKFYTPEEQRSNSLKKHNALMNSLQLVDPRDSSLNTTRAIQAASINPVDKQNFMDKLLIRMAGEDPEKVAARQAYSSFKLKSMADGKQLEENVKKYYEQMSQDELQELYIALSESYTKYAYDQLDKSSNKQNGLNAQYQKSRQLYEQSSEGKNQLLKDEIKKWNDNLALYDKVSPIFNEQGLLIKNFNGSLEELIKAFDSGILVPLKNIELGEENLAIDYIRNNSSGNSFKDLVRMQEAEDNWKELQKNVENLRFVSTASGISSESFNYITSFINTVSRLSNNTIEEVRSFSEAFYDLIYNLNKIGDKDLVRLVSNITTVRKRAERAGEYYDVHDRADPLWRRATSSSLGVDLTLMRKTNMTGLGALGLFNSQSQRSFAQNITKAFISATGQYNKNLFAQGNLVNSYDNTRAYDWNKTYRNMANAGVDASNSNKVLQAYISSQENMLETLATFIANTQTMVEEGANIFDPKYAPYLGDYFESLKATDVQAYNAFVDSSGNLRKEALDTAEAMAKQKNQVITVTTMLSGFKDALKSAADSASEASREFDIAFGIYNNKMLTGAAPEEIRSLMSSLISEYNNNERLKDMGITQEQFIEASLNKDFSGFKVPVPGQLSRGVYTPESIDGIQERINEIDKLIKEVFGIQINERHNNAASYQRRLIRDEVNNQLKVQNIDNIPEQYKNSAIASINKNASINVSDFLNSRRNINIEDLQAEKNKLQEDLENISLRNAEKEKAAERQNALYDIREGEIADAKDINNNLSKIESYIAEIVNQILSGGSTKTATEFFNTFANATNSITSTRYTAGIEMQNPYKSKYSTYGYGSDDVLSWMFGPATEIVTGNSYKQQRALNALGVSNKSMEQYLREGFMDENGKWLSKDKQLKNRDKILSEYSKLTNTDTNYFKDLAPEDQIAALERIVEQLGLAADKAKILENTFNNLNNTLKESFKSSLLDGWNNSWREIGKNIIQLSRHQETLNQGMKDYLFAWKDAAQSMIDAMGPAMAQAGLSLLPTNPTAGIALLAASGVAGIVSGVLSTATNEKDDQTAKLQSLKDLLSEIIDQAKVDADYYQKNLLHQNAVAEGYKISSVHDAVISSNGNIITTDPKDFLIATKNPGGLTGNGDVKVNFNFIDKSTGGKVQVQSTSQRRNADGSIDIEAVVVATVNKALANGDLDAGMMAMGRRNSGYSYAG